MTYTRDDRDRDRMLDESRDYMNRPVYDDIAEESEHDKGWFFSEVEAMDAPQFCGRCDQELPFCTCWSGPRR